METKSNTWFRGFDIIVGLVLIVSSFIIFFSTQSSLAMIVNILTLSVLLLGVSKLASGAMTEETPSSYRWLNIGSGAVDIILPLYVYLFPPAALSTTITILMAGLLIYGIDSFIVGFAKGFSGNIRALLMVAGIISIIASLFGFFDPALASITAISLTSLALLADGIEELTAGLTGHTAF